METAFCLHMCAPVCVDYACVHIYSFSMHDKELKAYMSKLESLTLCKNLVCCTYRAIHIFL